LAVNCSARQLEHPSLPDVISRALADAGLKPDVLELEITENATMENLELSARILKEISAMGVRIALDDFGTGYSMLGQLKQFPINTVKIDRAFVKDLGRDPDAATIVKALSALARSMSLTVVAEGVETDEQVASLRDLGCDLVQGFYFSPPVPPEEARKLLADPPFRPAAE
jgi:EAL domain-containing protein (putative c-di-GMP-specific phosphodiesterase class I)